MTKYEYNINMWKLCQELFQIVKENDINNFEDKVSQIRLEMLKFEAESLNNANKIQN